MCAEFTPGQPLEIEKLLRSAVIIRKLVRDQWTEARILPRGRAPIIFKNEAGHLEVIMAEFSLIPPWWNPEKAEKKTKDNRPVFATHNARLESIAEKPTFKDSFKDRHCLIPIQEFFESSLFGTKYPGSRLNFSSETVLFAAGCYADWTDKKTGETVTSFTIITHLPSPQILECGHDRMPVFLSTQDALEWLKDGGRPLDELRDFLLTSNLNRNLKMQVSVDRILKDGWQKRAPSESEIKEVRHLVAAI